MIKSAQVCATTTGTSLLSGIHHEGFRLFLKSLLQVSLARGQLPLKRQHTQVLLLQHESLYGGTSNVSIDNIVSDSVDEIHE